ncbi:SulP family inorganic anion transporter [Klebsiella sp. NPDC088457]
MNTLRQDSLAGVVVFLVALPLCLGIAQASGLPPFVGLLTGIIGGIVVTALSPSRFAVSGPAAGLVTIVVAAIETLGSFSAFLMALVLAGVLQLLFGVLRAGRFISLVPASVIKGMLAAIGILLIMQQIPVALGTAEETHLRDLAAGEALKKLRPQNPPPSPNREMATQGVGNLLSGLLGAMPITAVIVRSSVNVSSGARSKLSIFIHGVLLLICGLWFSGLLALIPLSSLAAVLIYTGYKLATPRLFISQFRMGAAQYVPFLATIGGIIAFGMLAGIGIGLAAQVAFSIWRSHRHSLQLARYDDHYVLRIQQNLTFLHNPHLLALLAKIPEQSVVIVEHDNVGYLDPDVQAVLDDFAESAPQRGIHLNQWPVAGR